MTDATLNKWEEEYNKEREKNHPKVNALDDKLSGNGKKFTVWLGGPGKSNDMYKFRVKVRELLELHNFDVMFSEDYGNEPDVATKEIRDIIASDLIILMALSPGSASECIEFAYQDQGTVKPKMRVFFPDKYTEGYVYRSLNGRHCLIGEESIFSLEKVENYDFELPVKILQRAVATRTEKYSSMKLMDQLYSNIS